MSSVNALQTNDLGIAHRDIALSGGRLHYVEAGSGDPVLLVHGGHGGWIHWMANVKPLSAHCRVLAVDLPGFGRSYDPGRCLMPEEHAEVLAEFLAQLKIESVALVGFSFGTLVASTLTVRRPDLVRVLTLLNPPGVGQRSPEALALPARLSALAKAQGRRAGVEGTLRELMLCHHELVDDDLIDLLGDSIARTRYVTRSVSQSSDTFSLLKQVTRKTMVLIGERDPFHSNDLEGRRKSIDAVLGAGAVRIVPGAAHWLQYDRPDSFNQALLDFIADTRRDAASV